MNQLKLKRYKFQGSKLQLPLRSRNISLIPVLYFAVIVVMLITEGCSKRSRHINSTTMSFPLTGSENVARKHNKSNSLPSKKYFYAPQKPAFNPQAATPNNRIKPSNPQPWSTQPAPRNLAKVDVQQLPGMLPGTLSGGEIHDFSKWELWKDIAFHNLQVYKNTWKIVPEQRHVVQVITEEGKPIIDCSVQLISATSMVWQAKTDNTGKAELWGNIFNDRINSGKYHLNINYDGIDYEISQVIKFQDGINTVKLPVQCDVPDNVDILFAVDATGSMKDEIQYLKSELGYIISKTKEDNPKLNIKLGSLFYRCLNNSYVTRSAEFTQDITKITRFINQQEADEGGLEAVEIAMDEVVNQFKWSKEARARILFLVLDESPGTNPEILKTLHQATYDAAKKGIRIVPIVASGTGYTLDKRLEYLMRAIALATNGTYTFLTDHSGVGNAHTKPTTDEYDVELLNSMILRIIKQFTFTSACDEAITYSESEIRDTMFVYHSEIIDRVIADSVLFERNYPKTAMTTHLLNVKSPDNQNSENGDMMASPELAGHQSNPAGGKLPFENGKFVYFGYYPNPTSGELTIDFIGNIEYIYFADMRGKILERIKVNANGKTKINIGKYPEGTYFLQYPYEKKWVSGKVVRIK